MTDPDDGAPEPMTDRRELLEALAALAAGELDDAGRAALEAQLGAEELTKGLEQIRAVNQLLRSQPEPELPTGAHERLLAAIEPVLDDELGREHAAPRTVADRLLGWLPNGSLLPRMAAGAAVLIVIAGAGIGLSRIGGQGSADTAAEEDGLRGVESLLESGATDSPDTTAALRPDALDARLLDGVYDEAEALALLDEFANARAVAESLPEPDDGSQADTGGGAGEAPAEDEAFAVIDECGAKPVESKPGTQLYAEAAVYEDEPAVLYIIERNDGSLELWVVAQADCGVLLFREADPSAG